MNFSPSQFLVHFCSRHDRVDKPQDLCYHTVGGYMNKSTPGKLKGREQEVVEAYLQGLSSPEVARQFLVSSAHEAVGRAFSPKSIDVTDEWK